MNFLPVILKKFHVRSVLYSPVVFALMITGLVLFFMPLEVKHHILEVSFVEHKYQNSDVHLWDLDADGTSEIASHINFSNLHASLMLYNHEGRIIDQWNTKHSYLSTSQAASGNFDHDIYPEMYVFTYKGDSLFFNAIEYFDPEGLEIKGCYLLDMPLYDGKVGYSVKVIGFHDADKDGYDEVYLWFWNGFPKVPRQLGYYNIRRDTLVLGPALGNNIIYPFFMDDFDMDGNVEITGSATSPGNYTKEVPITDHSAWFMVYNEQFQFSFKPIEFEGPLTTLSTHVLQSDSALFYVCCYHYLGTVYKNPAQVHVFDEEGNRVRTYNLTDEGFDYGYTSFRDKGSSILYLKNNKGRILKLDGRSLNLTEVANHPKFNGRQTHVFDLNADGENEFIFIDSTGYVMTVTGKDFKHKEQFSSSESLTITQLQKLYGQGESDRVVFFTDNEECTIRYSRNPYYYLEMLKIPMVFLVALLIVILVKLTTQYTMSRMEERNRQLTNLQLLTLKNQFDPHFTYNIINTLGGMLYKDDKDKAYRFLARFSSLLRRTLATSDVVAVSFEQELEMVREYLELQQERFENKFSFTLDVDKKVDTKIPVPRLILQTFVENAIKHGFMHKPGKGHLNIECFLKQSALIIIIQDNGIGRKAAKKYEEHSMGLGLSTLDKFLTILNEDNRRKIHYAVNDLVDEHEKPSGTKVELFIPLNFRYSGR